MTVDRHVLGLSAFFHNSAAAVVSDGRVAAALEEERVTRIKNDATYPLRAIDECLKIARLTRRDIDMVAFYERPLRAIDRNHRSVPAATVDRAFQSLVCIRRHLLDGFRERVPLRFFPHHLSHAASAFLCSPFSNAMVVVADGVGEDISTSIWRASEGQLKCVWRAPFPHSMGLFYAFVTDYLGFKPLQDEFKVMGLAAHGKSDWIDSLSPILRIAKNGGFEIAQDWLQLVLTGRAEGLDPEPVLGPRRQSGEPILPCHANLAAGAQALLTVWLGRLMRRAYEFGDGCKNLCLAGGISHNCRAIGELQARAQFDSLFVQPASGDAGAALGAALLPHYLRTGRQEFHSHIFDPYLGPEYTPHACRTAASDAGLAWKQLDEDELIDRVVAALVDGKIVGWLQGRAEFGPRALGNRSILANPLIGNMAVILNAKIKQREAYRPFAPAILDEAAPEYFEGRWTDPYMLVTASIKPPYRDILSAIVHVDGSARVQRVKKGINPLFHRLISAFGRRTGHPVLLNTSLNHSSEPMALSPQDAIRTAKNCRLDALVLENAWVEGF